MERELIASRCHDIQVSLGAKEVPDFEDLPKIGMMVNLSLHIRGLPVIQYDVLRLAAYNYFNISIGTKIYYTIFYNQRS